MISKAFEVCPSLFLIKLLFFMSSQIRDQKNILIPCITFQGERGKYMTKESLKSNKDRFTFICILTFETQKKKIPFDNSTRTRTSNFISRAFLWWSTYHIVIFFPMPCVLYANNFNNIIILQWMDVGPLCSGDTSTTAQGQKSHVLSRAMCSAQWAGWRRAAASPACHKAASILGADPGLGLSLLESRCNTEVLISPDTFRGKVWFLLLLNLISPPHPIFAGLTTSPWKRDS